MLYGCLRVLLFKNYLLLYIGFSHIHKVWEYCYSRIIFYQGYEDNPIFTVWEYCYSRIIFYSFYQGKAQVMFESIVIQELSSTVSGSKSKTWSLRVLLFKNYLLLDRRLNGLLAVWEYCYSRIIFYPLVEDLPRRLFESIVIQELSSTAERSVFFSVGFESIVIQELSST